MKLFEINIPLEVFKIIRWNYFFRKFKRHFTLLRLHYFSTVLDISKIVNAHEYYRKISNKRDSCFFEAFDHIYDYTPPDDQVLCNVFFLYAIGKHGTSTYKHKECKRVNYRQIDAMFQKIAFDEFFQGIPRTIELVQHTRVPLCRVSNFSDKSARIYDLRVPF